MQLKKPSQNSLKKYIISKSILHQKDVRIVDLSNIQRYINNCYEHNCIYTVSNINIRFFFFQLQTPRKHIILIEINTYYISRVDVALSVCPSVRMSKLISEDVRARELKICMHTRVYLTLYEFIIVFRSIHSFLQIFTLFCNLY